MQKWQNVLILGSKGCYLQTSALCWKSLKSSAPSAEMTKLAYLGLKTLICRNSCTLLKIAKKWCAKCKNRKTFWSRAENALSNKPVGPVGKWQNLLISSWKRCFAQTRALCWKWLKGGLPSAEMTKRADLGRKTRSARFVISALNLKRCFVQTRALC